MTDDAASVFAGGLMLRGAKNIIDDDVNHPCEFKSYDFADVRLRTRSPDSAILSYVLTQDIVCSGTRQPPKAYATSVYAREGGKWRAVSYQETAIP